MKKIVLMASYAFASLCSYSKGFELWPIAAFGTSPNSPAPSIASFITPSKLRMANSNFSDYS